MGNRSLLLAQYQRQGSGCIQNCLRKNSKPWVWLNWKEDRDLLIMSAMGKFEDSGRNCSESLTSLGMIPLSDNKQFGLPSDVVVEETPPQRGKKKYMTTRGSRLIPTLRIMSPHRVRRRSLGELGAERSPSKITTQLLT